MDLTVICPTFNRGEAIAATIQTVQSQTDDDWKMIVVSDSSTDNTDDVVNDIAAGDDRVRLVRTDHNFGGPAGPTNLALAQTETEWVAYIDHDDLWLPDHLETLALAIDTGADVVSTLAEHVDDQGNVQIRSLAISGFWHPLLQLIGPLFHNSSVAHKTELLDKAGGWNENGSGLEDWDLWLRFADHGAKVQAVAKKTVTVVRDGNTLLSSLPMDGFFPVASFDNGLEARKHLRLLLQPEVAERIDEAAIDDVYQLMIRLDESSELIHPLGWDEGLEAALAEGGGDAAAPELAHRTNPQIRLVDGQHLIGWPLATMSTEHAKRIVALGPELLPVSYRYLHEILPDDCLL